MSPEQKQFNISVITREAECAQSFAQLKGKWWRLKHLDMDIGGATIEALRLVPPQILGP